MLILQKAQEMFVEKLLKIMQLNVNLGHQGD